MPAVAAVCIDNNFAAGQARVAHRPAHDEAARRIDVKFCVFVHQRGGNHFADDFFGNRLLQIGIGD